MNQRQQLIAVLDWMRAFAATKPIPSIEDELRKAICELECCDWTDAGMFAGEEVISRSDVLNAIRVLFAAAPVPCAASPADPCQCEVYETCERCRGTERDFSRATGEGARDELSICDVHSVQETSRDAIESVRDLPVVQPQVAVSLDPHRPRVVLGLALASLEEMEDMLHLWMRDNTGPRELDVLERCEQAIARLRGEAAVRQEK